MSMPLCRCACFPFDLPQKTFFVFRDPQKRLKKNVLGPIRFGACFFLAVECRPYFCSVLRVRNSIPFSVFFGAVVFVFLTG